MSNEQSSAQSAPVEPEVVGLSEQETSRALVRARRLAGKLPFTRDVAAMVYALRDAETPLWVKGTVAAAIAYFVLPVDIVPDFIPIAGWGDDAAVIAAALKAVGSSIQAKHREQAARWLSS